MGVVTRVQAHPATGSRARRAACHTRSAGARARPVGYPCCVPTMFRRKPTAPEAVEPVAVAEPTNRSKAYTPSKRERGETTPKRGVANARLSVPSPKTRREAAVQSRDARVRNRREMREAMARGEEHALLPRDRGPDRRLVRDVVDARRNVGNYFFGGLLLILALSVTNNLTLALAGNVVFLLMLVALVIDSVLLSRRVKRVVRARMPEANPRWRSLYTYAVMRSISFRFMRMPKPQVKVGAKV